MDRTVAEKELKDNPYLNLADVQVSKVWDLMQVYQKSCKRKDSTNFIPTLVECMHEMKEPDRDFIFFLQNLQRTYRCKLGFYNNFLSILETPVVIEKAKDTKPREVKLYQSEKDLVAQLQLMIDQMIVANVEKLPKGVQDDLWRKKGVRAKVHFFLRFSARSAEELVSFSIKNKVNLSHVRAVVKTHCAQKYAKYGYYAIRTETGKLQIRHINHIRK